MNDQEIMELVESAADYAGSLYKGLEKVVEDLRADNVRNGLNQFAQVIEGMEWLSSAIIIINNAKEYGEFETEPAKAFFGEMVEAAENMDYVLLTDLIEYEILPIIDNWGTKLDEILEKSK